MRLTDEEIYKSAHKNTNEFFEEFTFESGMKASRDFYENQICAHCGKNACPIEPILMMEAEGNDCGCSLWELKQ